MSSSNDIILSIAVPAPLRQLFDYLPPEGVDPDTLQPGMRIQVQFGPRKMLGIIEAIKDQSDCPPDKLRHAIGILEPEPLLPVSIMKLCRWTAGYYHYSLGETLSLALPQALRQGKPASAGSITLWKSECDLDESLRKQLKSAKRQLQALELIQTSSQGMSEVELKEAGISKVILTNLAKKHLISRHELEIHDEPFDSITPLLKETPFTLNPEQQFALEGILETPSFHPVLLEGVTGSGKTEVYLQAITATLQAGKQALVLVPEIGLTPQTIERFRKRFRVPVVCIHSGLGDGERLQSWLAASRASAGILIATRSGVFTPMPRLGLIIIDEEHDGSYKQQDTLRYNARDLAIYRAKMADCPVVLGSATPSLESLQNARTGRYSHIQMKSRAGGAKAPTVELLDIRQQVLTDGFAQPILERIQRTLHQGHQVMVFLNRRGYAPSLICHDCGDIIDCPHCDAHMTLHRQPPHMHCHHCDYQTAVPWSCPTCQSKKLQPAGQGTERSEQVLSQLFPDYPVLRVDRDSTRRKDALPALLDQINEGKPCILLGTQMLAKGHHFPGVTLVAIINADGGLFSSDFRGLEKTGQLIMQVAGRSGRGQMPGHVIIQTHNPQHPALQMLSMNDYTRFANSLFTERQHLHLPPCGYLAVFRTESAYTQDGQALLQQLRHLVLEHFGGAASLTPLGPLPAIMEKRQGRFRQQLLLQSGERAPLHRALKYLVDYLDRLKLPKHLRWTLDVDPQEMT
ncbi:hypothetical protein GZ77_12610 [Endozoicomonas montiporae]|uniref:Replication restart protein PriA n=2 Tax=Endozoicomonas montiporae TaxID=1027273 RepID=A0A081N4A0_9GAMM|nr:primosomal protein N' [Endozoicomonas montiporae]AMO57884.1 primosome assembly protein PriA [Endozoicomonas montiporae CL-33]KEQ13273.1 hypothetical protein GZ77_12610 [Endozoicomonas montiporae]